MSRSGQYVKRAEVVGVCDEDIPGPSLGAEELLLPQRNQVNVNVNYTEFEITFRAQHGASNT